jgi:hypothetical protein
MNASATITYLQLDQYNDPLFEPSSQLTDVSAVSQAILTRLRLFLGEWWEDLNLGLPVFQKILGQLGTKKGIAAMNLAIQQQIEGVPYVTSVMAVQSTFENGQLRFTAKVQTKFGIVTVNNLPGASASLDS